MDEPFYPGVYKWQIKRHTMNTHLQQRIFGASTFVISLIVYLFTLEPSASFWDCSEFIACAYKLEVGHAPGAPVYMLLGRLFGLFAGGNTQYAALAINTLSAVASALTIMLLFHIIYWFSMKLFFKVSSETSAQAKHFIALLAALTGSLAYAFTDSFWFSAVEAEVYALSSLFSALVFWCITKYDMAPKGWSENRWLVLIFFLLGLSVGIHLLNLLALPAMALVVYYKHFELKPKNMVLTMALSVAMILVFIYGIIPGVVKTAAYLDLVFVNSFKLPVYLGALAFVFLLILGIVLIIHFASKTKKYLLRFGLVLISFWLIGYSSFAVLVIRSADNPFVDINNVENVFGLVDYLNREQYPQRPLIYGNNYNSPITTSTKRLTYKLYNEKYFEDELNPAYEYDDKTLSLFPRMASQEARHAEAYRQWVDIKGRRANVAEADGSTKTIVVPTFFDNVKFFIKYQVGYMYLRYFMWNFAGRQNDSQGYGDKFSGNWISGIPILDNWRLGNQDQIPDNLKNDKSRNSYYFIPLILGIIGLLFHLKHDKQNFWLAFVLFFFTGPAIVVYLNEVPITPRERDYVHVGSFMVFAIWIGLGAAAVMQIWMKYVKNKFLTWIPPALLFVFVPGLLLSENWDDHDRSGRYAAHDFGKNMLSSCAPNAILFTTADNDTYPIWYLQQVEDYRSDVRQVLATFLPMGWYSNQLNYNYPGSGSIPISFADEELLMKTNQYFPVMPRIDSSIDLKDLVQFIKNPDRRTQVQTNDGEVLNFIPGKKFSLAVDAENFLAQSDYLTMDIDDVPSKINFSISKNYLTRDELLLLDILANNNWKRPVYTIYPSLFNGIGLADYLHREGMLYRLLPYKNTNALNDPKALANHQFELLSQIFVWGNINEPEVFLDHTIKQMVAVFRYRQMFAYVADELITLGELEKAELLIDLAQSTFSAAKIPYDYFSADLARAYYQLGANSKADFLVKDIYQSARQNLDYYLQGKTHSQNTMNNEAQLQAYLMQEMIRISGKYNSDLGERLREDFGKDF
jgi:hypothetical protein